ncbi:MAG: phosphotransferase [Sedimentisphaerales bacterium]|nr:phosphotransferase [Sedimentisphaerales bacterium]
MNTVNEITSHIKRLFPEWLLSTPPKPFTWATTKHFRACLTNNDTPKDIIIRQSHSDQAYQLESFFYQSALPHFTVRTPKFLATFKLASDSSKWMALENIGNSTADFTNKADRIASLALLGTFHKNSIALIKNDTVDLKPLPSLPNGFIPFGGKFISAQYWRDLLTKALCLPDYHIENKMLDLLDKLLLHLAESPKIVLHGDTNPTNIVRAKDGLGLIDFERVLIGPPSLDLAQIIQQVESNDELDYYLAELQDPPHKYFPADQVAQWIKWAKVFDCFYWICYRIEQNISGKKLGDDWRKNNYDPMIKHLNESDPA